MKKTSIALAVVAALVLAGAGWYFFGKQANNNTAVTPPAGQEPPAGGQSTTTPTAPDPEQKPKTETVIGQSVEGRDIVAYHFGTGNKEILFVGGVHGGYSWNSALLAFQLRDYFRENASAVPANVKVTVIPVLNPDGLNKVVGVNGTFAAADITASQAAQVAARYNAHGVDLNRNFDCDWQPTGKWRNVTVNAGTAAFSEPETLALKNYIESQDPAAVVVWYSAAGGVFSSNCHDGVLAETKALTSAYASAAKYPAHESFDFYATTGDMTNWLAKNKIPGISVLLTNHADTELDKNKAGVNAVLQRYAD